MPLSTETCLPRLIPGPALRGSGWVLAGALLLSGCSLWQVTSESTPSNSVTPALAPPAPAASAPLPTPLPVPAPVAAAPAEPSPEQLAEAASRRLLAFHDRVRDLPPAELLKEQSRLDTARSVPDTDSAALTLELALVLAQSRQNGDLARAVALVEPLTRSTAPARWQPLARLLHARLAEQRRLEEQAERQAQQLRDQQRRLEQLNSQLEALKAIERSLSNRASPASTAPAPSPAPAVRPSP